MLLKRLLREWVLEGIVEADILESKYFEVNEIKIDPLHIHKYKEINIPQYTKAWEFQDRCGNTIVAAYIESISEFKTGYRIKDKDSLIFQPETLDNVEEIIRPCADDKKLGTIYKILLEEILPNYLLNKKPNKLLFNPVSESRNKLVDIIISKIIKEYPQLKTKNHYLINI